MVAGTDVYQKEPKNLAGPGWPGSDRSHSMMLCKIFLHCCEVFLTFFFVHNCCQSPMFISFAVQKGHVKCCSVVYTEMCIKHFVIFKE